jgi:cell division protein FtsB
MALPKQVELQLKEIEALEKQLTGDPEPPTDPAPDPEPPAEPQDPNPQDPPEPKPSESKTPDVSEETWQHKYKTLQGMYDAEVPRLHAQVKELQNFVAQLKQQLEAKPDPAPTQSTTTPQKTLVTDDEVEAFGKDLIEVQRKVAREVAMEFRAELDALKAENKELKTQIQQTGTQVGEVTFEQRLFQAVPDWHSLNADPKWIAWLDEFDPMLRAPRRAAAQGAYNAGDADGVAYYVKMFKDANAAPVADPKQAELERQVQPTRSATSQTPVSQKGKTYSTRDVEKMFLKIKDLNIAHKYDEAKKLEAEIDAAYMEGRVTA